MVAALDLLAENGFTALTLLQVAKRAKVSRGALNHYYPTKIELVIAAAHHAMDIEMCLIDEGVPTNASRTETFEAFLQASERFYLSDNFIALMELTFASRNNREIGEVYFPLIRQYRAMFDGTWIEALIRAGMAAGHAKHAIDFTNMSLRGLAMSQERLTDRGLAEKRTAVRKSLYSIFKEIQ